MRIFVKLLGLCLLAAGGSAQAAGSAKPVVPHVQKGPFPQITLPDRQSGGQRAIDLLKRTHPIYARRYNAAGIHRISYPKQSVL